MDYNTPIPPSPIPDSLLRLFKAIAHLGDHPDDTPELRLEKAVQLNTVVLIGLPVQLLVGGLMWLIGATTAVVIIWGIGFLSLLGLLRFLSHKEQYPFFRFTQLLVPILSPLLISLTFGGIAQSGFAIMWGIVTPILALIHYNLRQAFYWFFLYLFTVILAALLQPYLTPDIFLSETLLIIITLITIFGVSIVVFAALAFFVAQRTIAYQLLEQERQKADNLLINILPPEIAAILKNNNGTIAQQFSQTSILFADIVNFTPLSATLTPSQLVALLNEIFSHFDTLVEKYGVEKIKTIGDCYMVAAGVPRAQPDHAHRLLNLALEMQEYIACTQFHGQTLAFRMGLNSGPVVAGVIGRKKFIYDLWGDAVNTASRMESHGRGGVIQITQATYELVQDTFLCEPQGEVFIKGKGNMPIWYVVGRKNST